MLFKIDPKLNSNVTEIELKDEPYSLYLNCQKNNNADTLYGDMTGYAKIYKKNDSINFKFTKDTAKPIINITGDLLNAINFFEFSELLTSVTCKILTDAINQNVKDTLNKQNIAITNSGVGIFSGGGYSTTKINHSSITEDENALALKIEEEIMQKITPLSNNTKIKILNDLIVKCSAPNITQANKS
jgi:hypothetical protein